MNGSILASWAYLIWLASLFIREEYSNEVSKWVPNQILLFSFISAMLSMAEIRSFILEITLLILLFNHPGSPYLQDSEGSPSYRIKFLCILDP